MTVRHKPQQQHTHSAQQSKLHRLRIFDRAKGVDEEETEEEEEKAEEEELVGPAEDEGAAAA